MGCETIETCDAATSEIVAPARSAMRRCVARGMTRSSVPMRCFDIAAACAGVGDHDAAVGVADEHDRSGSALREKRREVRAVRGDPPMQWVELSFRS